ncbi:hypothetical protein V7S43_006242 [Phytophthora oleae]|uniref:Uncharacterized protein n=1 Tax=Phytophthora oleae TaxID=2107226 RepID=A0ABD3FRM1_9STRA
MTTEATDAVFSRVKAARTPLKASAEREPYVDQMSKERRGFLLVAFAQQRNNPNWTSV